MWARNLRKQLIWNFKKKMDKKRNLHIRKGAQWKKLVMECVKFEGFRKDFMCNEIYITIGRFGYSFDVCRTVHRNIFL